MSHPPIALHGVGVDAASAIRIAGVLARRPGFAGRVYTEAEQRDCEGRPERWASRWAAKEAVRKLAGGRGGAGMPAFRDVEVCMLDTGAPSASIPTRAHPPIALSLTHEGDLAIAVATVHPGPLDEPPHLAPADDLRLPARPGTGHKGMFGTVVVLAGSPGLSGAAFLAATGAARGGAGLVRLCVPRELHGIMAIKCTEVMAHALPDDGLGIVTREAVDGLRRDHLPAASALVVGPGLGRGLRTEAAITALLSGGLACPVVVDADGLNGAAAAGLDWSHLGVPVVVTPHPGEMARLAGVTTAAVQGDRRGTAARFARRYRVVVALKGSHTVVAAPDGRIHEDQHSVVALATGGTGDVLAGLLGAMISCGLEVFDAAVAAVTIHAEAGAAVQAQRGRAGALAGDLLDQLPAAQERLRRAVEARC